MNTILLTLSIYAWPLYFSIICNSESLMCVMGLRSWLQVAEEEVKELTGETTVTLIRSMKPERSFVGCYTLSLVSKQNAVVGRCLAWKKRWALEHLSVYSSRNTNLLENKRGKKFFSMVKEFGKHHILYLCTLPWGFIQLEMLKFPQLKKDRKSN